MTKVNPNDIIYGDRQARFRHKQISKLQAIGKEIFGKKYASAVSCLTLGLILAT
jgi:hypothetical protein